MPSLEEFQKLREFLTKIHSEAVRRQNPFFASWIAKKIILFDRSFLAPLIYQGFAEGRLTGEDEGVKQLYDSIPFEEGIYTKMPSFETNPQKSPQDRMIIDFIPLLMGKERI